MTPLTSILASTGPLWLYILIIVAALVILYAGFTILKARRLMTEFGGAARPRQARFPGFLLVSLIIASLMVWGLKHNMETGSGAMSYVWFVGLPYAALAIFLIGTVYRYRNRGFSVSSISSEFLERKKLFWGSQPFHWGILFLFFGHLIAFLFPRAVIAWNGEPVRLIILEVSAFAFGLATLLGLVLLISRRMGSNRVLRVTNRMDMVLYTILLVQLITGLAVAYFDRWGSNWFAGVLTPYLQSLFVFNPETAAVAALPWTIQVHIVFAFLLIAVFPFTRMMHFLVAPVDYLWRGYQLVIWNWGRKSIRTSRNYFYGKRPSNH